MPKRKPWASVTAIKLILDRNVQRARDAYKEDFGRSYKAKSIDREIERRFIDRDYDSEIVELPVDLVMAIMLRRGFNRDQSKRRATWVARMKPFVIEAANEHIRAKGYNRTFSVGAAKDHAAEDLEDCFKRYGITRQMIRRWLRDERRKQN